MAEEEGKRLAGLHASAEQAAEAQLHGQVLQREHENTEDQLFGLQQPMDEQQLTAKRSALQKDGADVWAQVAQHLQRHTQQFAGGLASPFDSFAAGKPAWAFGGQGSRGSNNDDDVEYEEEEGEEEGGNSGIGAFCSSGAMMLPAVGISRPYLLFCVLCFVRFEVVLHHNESSVFITRLPRVAVASLSLMPPACLHYMLQYVMLLTCCHTPKHVAAAGDTQIAASFSLGLQVSDLF